MELKDRIREAMEGAQLKPLQLAKATGRSSGAVTHWINGRTKSLKADTANSIQHATGYCAEWLISGKGVKKLRKESSGIYELSEAATGHGEMTQSGVIPPDYTENKPVALFNTAQPATNTVAKSVFERVIGGLYETLPDDPVIRAQVLGACFDVIMEAKRRPTKEQIPEQLPVLNPEKQA